MPKSTPAFLFNNCGKRPHQGIYSRRRIQNAFYDLNKFGIQAKQATDLCRGDECIVAKPSDGDQIVFEHYRFEREIESGDERVLCRKRVKAESLTRAAATRHRIYRRFFNVNHHFKRQATIRWKSEW